MEPGHPARAGGQMCAVLYGQNDSRRRFVPIVMFDTLLGNYSAARQDAGGVEPAHPARAGADKCAVQCAPRSRGS